LASIALGAVGLILFILPILALPIGGAGLVTGMAGAIAALTRHATDLRLSMTGMAVCLLAIAVSSAIAQAPGDYLDLHPPLPGVAPLPPRQFVPAPAPFHGAREVAWPHNLA
jgi:hypothetical protein